ncbi:MAG: hypothetical protein N2557_06855 [Hydrogenophilus sp.]|nr:hypothetical protein [Hydrogenophilus sp.]
MRLSPLDEPTLHRFQEAIAALQPRPHHVTLLAAAADLLPGCRLRHAYTQGGWHIPGGVIDEAGNRLSDDLEAWAEGELDASDGDWQLFWERHRDRRLLATRFLGTTHYFVADYAAASDAFYQLEIDELQEVADRPLLDPETPPADVVDLVDPPSLDRRWPIQVVGSPFYRFRRLLDARRLHLEAQTTDPIAATRTPLPRFFREWDDLTPTANAHFCDHWVLDVQEHLDRFGNWQWHVKPIARRNRSLRHFPWQLDQRGAALAEQLTAFDRAAGYRAAWYFCLVATNLTPKAIAQTIVDDHRSGYAYLSEKERALLTGWLENPYSF